MEDVVLRVAYAAGWVAVGVWVARRLYREDVERFGPNASEGICLLGGFTIGMAWPVLAPFVLAWLAYRAVRGVVFWRV